MNETLRSALGDIETEHVRIDNALAAAKARLAGVQDRIIGATVSRWGRTYRITQLRLHDNARIYCDGVAEKKDGTWGVRTLTIGYLNACKWEADPK